MLGGSALESLLQERVSVIEVVVPVHEVSAERALLIFG